MSSREARLWMLYRNTHGSMGDERRYDRPAAMIAEIITRRWGGKYKLRDFLPFAKKQEDGVATLEDIITKIGGVKHGQRKSRKHLR